MKNLALLSLLFFASCVPWVRGTARPTSPQAASIDAVSAEWRAAGLPWSTDCDGERERMLVAVVDDAEMRRTVGYCASRGPVCMATSDGTDQERFDARAEAGCLLGTCASASIVWEQSEPWPIGLATARRVTLILSQYESETTQLSALEHETAHALDRCNGGYGRDHRDPRIWGPGGVVERAAARR